MTPTEDIYRRLDRKPQSTLLLGGGSEREFVKKYFPKAQDVLWIEHLLTEDVQGISHFSSLAPIGENRVVVLKNLCRTRRKFQTTLLKMIEESPERTHWVISAKSRNSIIDPIISRSFVLDWILEDLESFTFKDDLMRIIENQNYLDIFKLHEKISNESKKDLTRVKEMHLSCLSELMNILPVSLSSKIHKARQEIVYQNRTEVSFKSALLEVIS